MKKSVTQKYEHEKISNYRQRLCEQEPLKESYHDHKENIATAILGFLLAVNVFLFDKTGDILERGSVFFVVALVGFIAIYTLGIIVLNRQYVMKRGAAAHSAAINSDLWAISSGTFDPDSIGMSPEKAKEANLKKGISDSRFVSEYWSSSYYDTYVKSYDENVFQNFDFRTLLFASLLGFLNVVFFVFAAYRQGIFCNMLRGAASFY